MGDLVLPGPDRGVDQRDLLFDAGRRSLRTRCVLRDRGGALLGGAGRPSGGLGGLLRALRLNLGLAGALSQLSRRVGGGCQGLAGLGLGLAGGLARLRGSGLDRGQRLPDLGGTRVDLGERFASQLLGALGIALDLLRPARAGLDRGDRLVGAGQPLGEAVGCAGGLGRVPARQLDRLLRGLGEPLDRGLRLADGRRRVAHLLRRGEQLGRVGRPGRRPRTQVGQLLAQVAEQPARLLVADRLDLHLLDACAEPLDERPRLVQLAPQALALDGVVGQLADALPQLVELTAQATLALAAVVLGGQRLLQRLELGARGNVLVGQVAPLLLAGTLDLL